MWHHYSQPKKTMNELQKKLLEFLTAYPCKKNSKEARIVEISYCQGYIAALPEGEEKKNIANTCTIFHFAGRSIL